MPEAARTRKNLAILTACQALLTVNASGVVASSGLIGHALASNKALATLPASTFVLGSALVTLPAALWMAKVGRRTGFMTGAAVNIVGCALAAYALSIADFALFCVATAIVGAYQAIGMQYRFAAAEIVAPGERASAISLVLAGGIAGGVLGPETVRLGKDHFATPFLGSFVALGGFALIALALQSRLAIPRPAAVVHDRPPRPLREIVRRPAFFVAAFAGAASYGIMNLLMVATPLAMDICGHPFAAAAFVIEWHIVAMYLPALATGHLIRRFGVFTIIATGALLMGGCVAIALSGTSVTHFVVALMLLGVGWNFMYTGGTALLTEDCAPADRARTQGANDFLVFATMGVSSLSSGALVTSAGWETMNLAALPVLAAVLFVVVVHASMRRRHATRG